MSAAALKRTLGGTQVATFCRTPAQPMRPQEEEALWHDLVAWCDARHLFIGGSPDAAVIYSPFEDGLPRHWKALRRRLERRMQLDSAAPTVVELGDLPSPRLRRACLEAVSQAQRQLAERVQECADSLAVLSCSKAMRMAATVVDSSRRLEIRTRGDLMITLSRRDGKREPAFDRFMIEPLRAADLAELIADWPVLHWEPAPGDDSQAQWVAHGGKLRIILAAAAGSNPDRLQPIRLFWQLMSDE
jgi:hypothetical protein